MSSHREAPGDLEGPGRRQHRPVRLRQPGQARHRHDHRQLHPARGPGRRPELLRVRRRRALRDQHRQQRRRRRRHHLPVPVPDTRQEPEHVPLQHRPDHAPRQPQLEPHQTYTGHPDRRAWPSQGPRLQTSPCPPVNIGPRSTPNYAALAQAAVHTLSGGSKVFAGQRRRRLLRRPRLDLRPRRPAAVPEPAPDPDGRHAGRQRARRTCNVHTIAIQVPMTSLTKGGCTPTDPTDPRSVIGVYASRAAGARPASCSGSARTSSRGPLVQVSRLGNPLFNEVIIPMAQKDYWNAPSRRTTTASSSSSVAASRAGRPAAGPLPGRLPEPRGLHARTAGRPRGDPADRHPVGASSRASRTSPGPVIGRHAAPQHGHPADDHRARTPSGILGGDLAGFPNGRRVFDDVVTIELRAIAGVTIPLVDPTFTPDGAAGAVTQGLHPQRVALPGHVPVPGRAARRVRQPLQLGSPPAADARPLRSCARPVASSRTARWSS